MNSDQDNQILRDLIPPVFSDAINRLSGEELTQFFVWIIVDPLANQIRTAIIDGVKQDNNEPETDFVADLETIESDGPMPFALELGDAKIRVLLRSADFLRQAHQATQQFVESTTRNVQKRDGIRFVDVEPTTARIAACGPQSWREKLESLWCEKQDSFRRLAMGIVGGNDCDDVLQEVFQKLLRKEALDFEDRSKGEQIKYLDRTICNTAIDHLRQRNRYPVARLYNSEGENYDVVDPASISSVLDRIAQEESGLDAMQALQQLDPKMREVIERWVAGEKPREIAEALGLNVQTVYTRKRRGLKKIKQTLASEGDE